MELIDIVHVEERVGQSCPLCLERMQVQPDAIPHNQTATIEASQSSNVDFALRTKQVMLVRLTARYVGRRLTQRWIGIHHYFELLLEFCFFRDWSALRMFLAFTTLIANRPVL